MAVNDYTYTFASNCKLSKNFGRFYFDDTVNSASLVSGFTTIDGFLVPGVKSQLNGKVKWFDKRSLPTSLKDWHTGYCTLYNSSSTDERMTVYIPGVKAVMVDGVEDMKATVAQMYDIADELISMKLNKKKQDGSYVLMDKVLSAGVGVLMDKTQDDSSAAGDTP